jgi:hypothetical protein
MHSTRDVIAALKSENPGKQVTEEHIRHALRKGDVPKPMSFAGRLAWTDSEVQQLARCLGLRVPISISGDRR